MWCWSSRTDLCVLSWSVMTDPGGKAFSEYAALVISSFESLFTLWPCVFITLFWVFLWCLSPAAELQFSEMLLRMELKGYENNFLSIKLQNTFLIKMMPVADPVRVQFFDEVGFLTH